MLEEKPAETAQVDPGDEVSTGEDAPDDRTPQGDDPVREDGKGTDYKSLHHANQARIEELKRERDEAIARAASTSQPAGEKRTQDDLDARDVRIAELRRLAPSDPASAAVLDLLEETQALRRDTADAMTLQRVPAEKQGPVLDFYEKHRQKAGWNSLSQCLQYIEGREAKTEAAALRKRVAELEAAVKGEAKVNADDVVRTRGQDLPATKKAVAISEADWRAEQAALTAAGKHEERRARQRALAEGKLVLKR